MMKCETTTCFYCIRNVLDSGKYDFASECSIDVMCKMDDGELEMLAREVLQAVLDVDTYETNWDELTILGDCLSRVYMHTLTRGRYLVGAFLEHENVEEVIRIAAEKSMTAYGILSMHENNTPFPQCWMEKSKP